MTTTTSHSLGHRSLVICSPVASRSPELLQACKITKSHSASWKGVRRTRSPRYEHEWSYLSQNKEQLHPHFCLDLLSRCSMSSTSYGHYPRRTYAAGQGFREGVISYGLADEPSQLAMVAGNARSTRFQVAKVPRRRRHRWRTYPQVRNAGGDRSFIEHRNSKEGKRFGGTSRQRKSPGLKSVPDAVRFTTDSLPNGSLHSVCCCCSSDEHDEVKSADAVSGDTKKDESVDNSGVKMALALLRFYKREISPILPASCRYVPTCSEYAQQAYKKYGFVKGSILTAWRLARCNPLGSSGFDPPRWFGEERPPQV
ncbi:hypothetical protein R1sor_003742 [Riccia sorocarpa]|uniref:Membrane protein insertion efficiency factor n=1 Tax=Riccia sorocarpa TaxID=122646 RepID=A0ABD3H5U4_9MARC